MNGGVCKVCKLAFPVVLLVGVLGCDAGGLVGTAGDLLDMPRVVASQHDYQEDEIQARVPDSVLFPRCCTMYHGCYTDSLKNHLIQQLMKKSQLLGLDTVTLRVSLQATGQLAEGAVTLPYLAERASFEGKQAWIFEFAWGVEPNDLGHFRCYVMSVETQDRLLFISCL